MSVIASVPLGPEPRAERLNRFGRPVDIHGQRLPVKLGALSFIEAIPQLASRFNRKVPANYWTLDGDDAVVACPCRGEPHVTATKLTACPTEDCPRYYLFVGGEVYVAGSPVDEPPPADEPEAPNGSQ